MICPKCNKEVPIGSNICPSCGTDLIRLRMNADSHEQTQYANGTQRRGSAAKNGTRRRTGAAQSNPQALIVAGGLVIVFLVLLVLLFRAIFGGDDQTGTPGGQTVVIESPSPSPTFKIFGVDVNTPEPVETPDPLANLQIEATPTPAPTQEPTYETLKKGSKGEDVKRLQQALIALGYLEDGGADGDFGNGTLTAVKEFQKDNGLTADGQAGQQTLSLLYRQYGGDIDTGSSTSTGTDTGTAGDDASALILNQPG